jgi:hypothetical protein
MLLNNCVCNVPAKYWFSYKWVVYTYERCECRNPTHKQSAAYTSRINTFLIFLSDIN